MSQEKISLAVLIPAYNVSQYIENCINSVVEAANYAIVRSDNKLLVNIIIYDDGSTDDTHAKLEKIISSHSEKDIVFTIIGSYQNEGRGKARNQLVDAAVNSNCKYGMWVDADDEVCREKIYLQLHFMETNSHVNYSHTAMRNNWDIDGNYILNTINYGDNLSVLNIPETVTEVTPQNNKVNGCTVMFRVDVQKDYLYKEDREYDGVEDLYMWMEVVKKHPIYYIDVYGALYHYRTKWKLKKVYVFRFDDVSSNQPPSICNQIAFAIKQLFPDSEIHYAISPLVFNLSAGGNYPARNEIEAQRPFPKIFNAYSDYRCFFSTDKIGMFNLSEVPNFVTIKSHGLFHVDHRLLTKEQQEMSIIAGCSLVGSNKFTPPFNKFNSDTIQICKELNVNLDNFNDGWRCMEHEDWDAENKLWYLHPRDWTIEKIVNYFKKDEG